MVPLGLGAGVALRPAAKCGLSSYLHRNTAVAGGCPRDDQRIQRAADFLPRAQQCPVLCTWTSSFNLAPSSDSVPAEACNC